MLGTVTTDAERAIDERIDELLTEARTSELPLDLEQAAAFLRASYGRGYTDALETGPALVDAHPQVGYPMLFLP